MSVIYLVRHGQASFAADNYDCLSAIGIKQSKLLGQSLKQRKILPGQIITGTMQRHHQTAKACLSAFENPIQPSPLESGLWNEFDHMRVIGAMNSSWSSPQQFINHLNQQTDPDTYFINFFGKAIARWISGDFDKDYIEPWSDFKSRVLTGFDQLIESTQPAESKMVFTSGGAISVVVMSLLNLKDDQFLKINQALVNCGITKIIKSARGAVLSCLNEHAAFENQPSLITYK